MERLWNENHSPEEMENIRIASSAIQEIIAFYCDKIDNLKNTENFDKNKLDFYEKELNRFQEERSMLPKMTVVNKIINQYLPSIHKILTEQD